MSRRRQRTTQMALVNRDETVQSRNETSSSPINYYLKFQFGGLKEPFVYIVGKEDWDRVSALFEDGELPLPYFVGFDDVDGKTAIHVRPKFVLLFQALFDAGTLERKQARDGDLHRVTFYVKGIIEPVDYDYVDQDQVGELNVLLTHFHDELSEFISFMDKDGEQNSIRAESIMLIESPNYYPPLDQM